ncbi:hypothetical protein COO91_05050 [Nostoc flagelliforme CCNUN1]|uniref:Uncharacterized protein n=2 Tax=Nostoc flagelliforme TaxID=1306274 RepID=A0A2K8SUC6_9NOSO|nr:hypothetical protein COO91_01081 [Nostoc flagelliforme CCNUN1]AUB39062.1 hypothetical protein COO91_05050 [Nostoc flagelliforme CCNUN1]
MHLSEVMTIAMASPTPRANAFHGSGYKTFKEFYTNGTCYKVGVERFPTW